MKIFAPIMLLIVVVASLMLFFLYRPSLGPAESSVIAEESSKLAGSQDKIRIQNETSYARTCRMKLQRLDYLLAKAYNRENMPDAAIQVLLNLVEGSGSRGVMLPSGSSSCMREAKYYEALRQAYALKHEKAKGEAAGQRRALLIAKAKIEAKREQAEEGRSLRTIYGD